MKVQTGVQMKALLFTLLPVMAALPAAADEIIRVKATGTVPEVTDRLETAVTGAGATVFARIDHGAGAESVGTPIGGSELLIFGNPELGTPVLQADRLAGLYLPLKVLTYEDAEGAVWLAYEDPEDIFDELEVPKDAEALKKMSGALQKLTAAAAGG